MEDLHKCQKSPIVKYRQNQIKTLLHSPLDYNYTVYRYTLYMCNVILTSLVYPSYMYSYISHTEHVGSRIM